MSFSAEHMVITLPKSKTDQFRDGSTVMVARSGPPTCPVAMLECYFSKVALVRSSTALVFRGIVNTKTGERLRKSGGISYSRVWELMLQRLSALGFDPTVFGMHSFRQVVLQQQRMQVCQTVSSIGMGDGSRTQQKTVM